jgi:hypothetical protein
MRKSLIVGTKEDVAKRRAKQSVTQPVFTPVSDSSSDNVRKRIVTFNHPILGE